MAVSLNLAKKLDRAAEDLPLMELLEQPPSALAGLTAKHDELFGQLGIRTVRDLGSNKDIAFAQALVALAAHEG